MRTRASESRIKAMSAVAFHTEACKLYYGSLVALYGFFFLEWKRFDIGLVFNRLGYVLVAGNAENLYLMNWINVSGKN